MYISFQDYTKRALVIAPGSKKSNPFGLRPYLIIKVPKFLCRN